jgi:hypothetical protein
MTAKISEAKRRAFLKAHAQSGSVTLSAARRGVPVVGGAGAAGRCRVRLAMPGGEGGFARRHRRR